MLDLKPTKEQRARARLLENRQWFDGRADEIIAEHAGRYVAVHGNKILGVGDDSDALWASLDPKIDREEVFLILVQKESVHRIPYAE